MRNPGAARIPGASRCILVVEYYPEVRGSLSEVLRILGHDVLEAADGEMALTVAQHGRPDVILLDLGLPDMDGYELARKLRAAPGGDRPFVIALTGRSREEVFDQVRASGCDGHLLKPYEVDQLEQALAAVPRRDYGVPQNPAMPSSAPSTRSAAKHSRATAAACADAEE